MWYPALQNAALDQEYNHRVIPGAWRDQADLADMIHVGARNPATRAAKAGGHDLNIVNKDIQQPRDIDSTWSITTNHL